MFIVFFTPDCQFPDIHCIFAFEAFFLNEMELFFVDL